MELTGTATEMLGKAAWPSSRRPHGGPILIRWLRERRLRTGANLALRDLDRLDDRLLRDVRLRRERVSGSAPRVVRF